MMALPITAPITPMLAKRIDSLPAGDTWSFEPKWDGFRVLVFRDGAEVLLQSRDGKSLNRYFPELLITLGQQLPNRCILDGEIVIASKGGLDFDALQLRVHPAASRVKLLSEQTPASIVFFDVLALDDRNLMEEPFATRRAHLEQLLATIDPPLYLTPATQDRDLAEAWFRRFEGAGLDGVMAKPLAGSYQPDKRTMFKVKHERDCDCVVAGFRWHKQGEGTAVGSLLLGLYDVVGELQHVGVCASFTQPKRRELVGFLKPFQQDAISAHPWAVGDLQDPTGAQRIPGGQSRWSQGKDLSWVPLRPELVVEVAYEHMQGNRFRHMAQFRRWRTDKSPQACNYQQLEVVAPQELMEIFPERRRGSRS